MQRSVITLANGFVSGHAVTHFRDTLYGHCSLLNVHVHCDGDTASCVGEYIDGEGDLVGVAVRFACTSMNEALRVMYRFARMEKPDVGLGDVLRHFANTEGNEVYDYSVMTLEPDYRWPDYSEIA